MGKRSSEVSSSSSSNASEGTPKKKARAETLSAVLNLEFIVDAVLCAEKKHGGLLTAGVQEVMERPNCPYKSHMHLYNAALRRRKEIVANEIIYHGNRLLDPDQESMLLLFATMMYDRKLAIPKDRILALVVQLAGLDESWPSKGGRAWYKSFCERNKDHMKALCKPPLSQRRTEFRVPDCAHFGKQFSLLIKTVSSSQ